MGRWMAFWIFSNFQFLSTLALVPLRRNGMTVLKVQQQQQWEPFSPCGVSSNRSGHRERRRLLEREATTSSSSIPEEVKDSDRQKQEGTAKPQRRVNRPGFNSYLEVLLDETTMDFLHEMAVGVQSRIQQEEKYMNEQKKTPPLEQETRKLRAHSKIQAIRRPRSESLYGSNFGLEDPCI
jgi:hypothetical protein